MTTTAKQRALEAVQALPDDASFEDVIDRLAFVAAVERGLRDADSGRLIPHEEVERRFVR